MAHRITDTAEQLTRDAGTETQWARTCPLCEFETAHSQGIYLHLQTSHRKSTLATALLEDGATSE
jgi:hypothetical protein